MASWNDLLSYVGITPPVQNGLGPPVQPIWNAANPVGTETTRPQQELTMPSPDVRPGVPYGGTVVSPQFYDMTQHAISNALGWVGSAGPGGGVRAYHGSPHSFERFDTSKIGTGEGAQAYGHGLYFAENEGTAKFYRDYLAQPDAPFIAMDTVLGRFAGWRPAAADVREALTGHAELTPLADNPHVIDAITRLAPDYNPKGAVTGDALRHYRTINEAIEAATNKGSMYEVNIGADPEHFLHWDKPLSEQHPKVQEAVRASGVVPDPVEVNTAGHFGYSLNEFKTLTPEYQRELIAKLPANHANYARDPVGAEVYEGMAKKLHTGPKPEGGGWTMVTPEHYTDPAAAAAALRDAGIPGIRYLDQGSRRAGEGSHNYVVFSDDVISILRKYGLAGLMAGGAATGAVSSDNQ